MEQAHSDVLARAMLGAANSYHEIIGPTRHGVQTVHILVPHHLVAWHADARLKPGSTPWWQTERNNENTLGLCITQPADSITVTSFLRRCSDLCRAYQIPLERVWLHRDVSFSRTDPRPLPDIDEARRRIGAAL